MILRNKALKILTTNTKNKNLVKHALGVEAVMGVLAKHFNDDEERWKLVGLMHDSDWERTQNDHSNHAKMTVEWLKQAGENDKEIIDAILSHNWKYNGFREPQSKIEWALYCCDELTGLIIAVALVRPEKKLSLVTVESILKKFPQKAFAAGVDREQIKLCETKLGISLPEFIEMALKPMQEISSELGL